MTTATDEISSTPVPVKAFTADIVYEGKAGVLHACESAEVHFGIRLVWTKCDIDVPSDKVAYPSKGELITCPDCINKSCGETA